MTKSLLVIEDHDDVVEALKIVASEMGFDMVRANDGVRGLELALAGDYACILLDIMLPGMEGTEVCKLIRQKKQQIPIILLTSKSDDLHKILGLELGADDYVTKPFNYLELKARIRAVLRRSERRTDHQEVLEFGHIVIDITQRQVTRHGSVVKLTALQFDILLVLALHPSKPFTREQLCEQLFGHDMQSFDQSLSVHISRIRARLEDNVADPQIIVTARGVGYKFVPPTDTSVRK